MRKVDGSTFLGVRAARISSLVVLFVAIRLLGPWSSAPRAQAPPPPGLYGQWRTLSCTMPINPVHMALLKNGKVLVVAGTATMKRDQLACGRSGPGSWGGSSLAPVSWDMFCNGMVTFPDGRPNQWRHLQYDSFWGQLETPCSTPTPARLRTSRPWRTNMVSPTTVLGDGRVMTYSGLRETGGTNTSVEIYTPDGG